MKLRSVNDFAEQHNMHPQRIRKLLRQERVFPYQRLGNGRYILYANTVIVRPYERPNRKLRAHPTKDKSE